MNKRERARLAVQLADLARAYQARLGRDDRDPSMSRFYLEPCRDLAADFRLRKDDGPIIVSWFIRPHGPKLSRHFNGYVNPYHRQKATQIAYGPDGLLAALQSNLDVIKAGKAFVGLPT